MKTLSCLFACCLILAPLRGQDPKFDTPATKAPDEKTMQLIQQKMASLREAIKALPENTSDEVRVDVEIFLKAAEWAVRHHEFFDEGKSAITTLDRGLERAKEAVAGKSPWINEAGKKVVRAYRSRVDESLQPYAVTYPPDFGKDKMKKWRLDVVLHGRDSAICETKFIASNDGKNAAKDHDFVQLDVYGRGNNAYRWAGETDVAEATRKVFLRNANSWKDFKDSPIDIHRVVLRGFSMGGAGTWHLGLQSPSVWCVIGPGAGFTTTHSYVKSLPNPLPPYQEPLLHIYDAVDYAENAFNVPIVAYSGEKDAQKAAADNIEKRLKELKINTMTHLIGPGLMHQFPAEWQAKAEIEYAKYAGPGKGSPDYPAHIRFVTYTLKYATCGWVSLNELEKHYELARVEAAFENGVYKISTKNVKAMGIRGELSGKDTTANIDGQELPVSDLGNDYEKQNGKWAVVKTPYWFHPDGSRKTRWVTGPIDDAFTNGFICVKGSQVGWHEEANKAADAQLERFAKEWDKWMRGKLIIKKDTEVTEEDIKKKHLILFGDPGGNVLIAKAMSKLPIIWTKNKLEVNGKDYDPAKDLPMLIYPNPLNPKRYVVLNSGHTFHEAEFKGTNALLFPRLGDWAVVRPTPTAKEPAAFEVIKSGIFDDSWKFAEK